MEKGGSLEEIGGVDMIGKIVVEFDTGNTPLQGDEELYLRYQIKEILAERGIRPIDILVY